MTGGRARLNLIVLWADIAVRHAIEAPTTPHCRRRGVSALGHTGGGEAVDRPDLGPGRAAAKQP